MAAAELVIVASPIEQHFDAASFALEQRRHVFVEKPLAEAAHRTGRLEALASRRGVRLLVGHSERFNPVTLFLKRHVSPVDIRRVVLCREGMSAQGHDHDVLLNLGVHDIDLFSFLTESTDIRVRAARRLSPHAAEMTLAAGSGAFCQIKVDRAAPERRRTIWIDTSRGTVRGDLLTGAVQVADTRADVASLEPLALQAVAMAAALRGETSSCATGADGHRAVSLAEAAAHACAPSRRTAGAAENLSPFAASCYPTRNAAMG